MRNRAGGTSRHCRPSPRRRAPRTLALLVTLGAAGALGGCGQDVNSGGSTDPIDLSASAVDLTGYLALVDSGAPLPDAARDLSVPVPPDLTAPPDLAPPPCRHDEECAPGWACCAGRCIDVQSDVNNCGHCNLACAALPNAGPGCAGGVCGIGQCQGDFLDCDSNAANGCETDRLTDRTNCGACGHPCAALTNQQANCAGGACVASCNPGFADCDKDPANGCEVNLGANAGNCGACGVVCPLVPNAAPGCSQGKCGIASCKPGFGDCNKLVGDGCETSLTTLTNCGACGIACGPRANAVVGCIGGGCGVVACNPGFDDCDGDPSNGCEPAPCQCKNGVKDADETDVDCGGKTCHPCGPNQICNVNADCVSMLCNPRCCHQIFVCDINGCYPVCDMACNWCSP